MKSVWKQNLAMLWFSQLMVMAGYDAMNPFIPLFMENGLGLTETPQLAYYASLYYIAGFIGYGISNPLWGWLGDKYGMKSMLLRGTFLTSVFWPMMAYVQAPIQLVFLRFITAFLAGTSAASQMMLARTAPVENQGFAQGMLTASMWAGTILGNVAGGLLIHYFDYRIAFWGCGVMYFLAGLFIIFTEDKGTAQRAATENTKAGRALSKLPAATWIIILLFMLMGLIRRMDLPYTALGVELHTPAVTTAFWTGIVSAIIGIGAIISGVLCGKVVDGYEPKKTIIPILALVGIFTALQTVGGLWTFTAMRTLAFFVAGAIQPTLLKLLTRKTPHDKRGLGFGLSTTSLSIGGIGASSLAGLLLGHYGINAVFLGAGIIIILSIPLFYLGISRTERYPNAQ